MPLPHDSVRATLRAFSCLTLSWVALAVVNGCSRREQPADSDRPVVALVMKSLANEFFSTMADGARRHQQANPNTYELIVNGTKNETDLAEQVNLIEQMVARGAKAIVIAPADSKAVVPALRRAHDAGVVIVNIDNRLDEDVLRQAGLTVPFVGPDNRAAARRVGEAVARQLAPADKVAIIEGLPTAFNGQQRRLGFEDAMRAAGLQVVSIQSGQWEMDKANAIASALLSEHPDLKAILCANDSMAMGAVSALQAAGRKGQVLVAGFDHIAAIRQMLADGSVAVTADQHGDQLAVFGIGAALAIIRGEAKPANRDTPVDVVVPPPRP